MIKFLQGNDYKYHEQIHLKVILAQNQLHNDLIIIKSLGDYYTYIFNTI